MAKMGKDSTGHGLTGSPGGMGSNYNQCKQRAAGGRSKATGLEHDVNKKMYPVSSKNLKMKRQ